MFYTKRQWSVMLLFFIFNIVSAQNQINYNFKYLQIKDGLSQNTITCIEQDKFGFMWIGTNNGVCLYDSYNFELFQSDESIENSLPNNLITAIKAGNDNYVWIGSTKGLSYYDHMTNEITLFNDIINSNTKIHRVSFIEIVNEQVWVTTEWSGIFLIEKTDNNYEITKHYCVKNKNLTNNNIHSFSYVNDSIIYVGADIGFYIYDKKHDVFVMPEESERLSEQTIVNDIFIDSYGNKYFATQSGLYVYFLNDSGFTYFNPEVNPAHSLKHSSVNMIREDISGQILVASLGGLQKLDLEKRTFIDFQTEGPDNYKINNEFVNVIFCDKNGNVWIGTEKGGINKFNVFQNSFGYYNYNPNNPNSLNSNTINSIYTENNSLWIGTAGGGLNLYDKETKKFTRFETSADGDNSISSDFVTSITRGSNGLLYYGTWGVGLHTVESKSTSYSIERILIDDPKYTGNLVNDFVSCLLDSKEGYLIIGTEGGLSKLDYRNSKFTTLIAPENEEENLTEIGCILLDRKGYYWVGTRNGLFRFPKSALRETLDEEFVISQLDLFKHLPNDKNSLAGDYVISLLEDSKGNIWVGTYGSGLSKLYFDESGDLTAESYSIEHGLSNNVIYGILEDKNQKIWLSTDYGLSVLNPVNNDIRNFYKQDGLLNNQFYWSAAHKSKSGILYFGGTEGLNFFDPEEFYDYNYFPVPKITQMRIFNEVVLPQKEFHNKVVLSKPIYNIDTIFLDYKDNNISFEFSSFDYYLPEKSQFAYQLSSIDKDWVTVSADRRYASYNNLRGGTYTFKLKASNCDGVWNETPTVITIIVSPPFWQTIWFKILLFILATGLIYLFIWINMRRIIAQKRILEEKVKLRTKEIESQKQILEDQAIKLKENNTQLEQRQIQIEQQKEELETKNNEISKQRDELILLNERVNEVNKLQLRFFTNISHEFQTPLTLIISPIERLISKPSVDAEMNQIFKIISRNAHRLLLLIKQLLEIRKIETGNQTLQVELTDTKAFLISVFGAFDGLAKKNNIKYSNNINASQSAWIDKDKLENVLYNLLSNAFKFTPENESINVEVTSQKVSPNNETLTISVSDTGEGIAPNKISKLFDRFLQVTDSRKHKRAGTGIGLSLVKSLVEIMYGNIDVKSMPQQGTTFTITIPISKNKFADHEIDTTGQVFESNIKNKVAVLTEKINDPEIIEHIDHDELVDKILVVEDNDDMRNFICSSISQYFYVLEATNGIEGFELAKKELPAIIISDVMMPEMDGHEFCKKVKSNLYTSHIPLIMLTAKSSTEDQVEGLKLGADDYMTKPFNIEILLAKIKMLIDNRNKLRSKFGRLEDVKPDELRVSDLDSKFYEKANEIVNKYYTEPNFDVDQFASEMFVSRSQLYSKLKAITSLSANEFINTFRLKKSIELISEGELQISEVAYAVGFNDPKYFSRIFKKFYKKTPSEYFKQQ